MICTDLVVLSFSIQQVLTSMIFHTAGFEKSIGCLKLLLFFVFQQLEYFPVTLPAQNGTVTYSYGLHLPSLYSIAMLGFTFLAVLVRMQCCFHVRHYLHCWFAHLRCCYCPLQMIDQVEFWYHFNYGFVLSLEDYDHLRFIIVEWS